MQKIPAKQKIGLILFGLFLFVILLEVGLRIGGLVLLFLQERRNRVSLERKDEYRILCFGESSTVWGGRFSWPDQLEQILNQKDIGIKFKVINKGRHAIQTSYIRSILEKALDEYKPDMVVTMMGINDGDNTVPYEDGRSEGKQFFTQLKIFKLIKLLRLHILHKVKEFGYCRLKREKVKLKSNVINVAVRNKEEQVQCSKANDRVEQPIENNLENDRDYIRAGKLYMEQERYPEAGEMFKKALEVNPNDDSVYVDLGLCYREQGRYTEAEGRLRKALEINPSNGWVYVELGNCYKEQGQYEEAGEMFKKALEVNPNDDSVYVDLGLCYREQGRYTEAEGRLRKALEINPSNGRTYVQLGICYRDQEKYNEAENILKKAVEINPRNYEAYIELGLSYREQAREVEQGEMLKRAIKVEPNYDWAYIQMGWFYGERQRYAEAEEMFKKAIKISPRNSIPYIELGYYYREQGKFKEDWALSNKAEKLIQGDDRFYGYLASRTLERGDYTSAEKYFRKAESIRMRYYPAATHHNYQKLREIVTQKGIRLVCVQYPMRNVGPLKKLLDSIRGIIFVDNEKIFKEAVKRSKYYDYFADNFAGDFGHCTPKGNRLLAENIANVILREVFNK